MQIHFSFSISFPFKRKASVRAHNDLTPHLRYPFMALAQKQVRKQRCACRPSTIRNYLTALRSFDSFRSGSDLDVRQVTSEVIQAYQQWLSSHRVSRNTSSAYLRSLRALYNKVYPHSLIRRANPFLGAFTGNAPTAKRALGADDVRRLSMLDISATDATLRLVRDVFLFSIYAMGMPFVDVARLRYEQIADGYLVYERRKTGQTIRVKMDQRMLVIIRRYQRQAAPPDTDYVFPILASLDGSLQGTRRYASALGWYNRQLKRLTAMAHIRRPLSSYVARHTWASLAYRSHVALPVISEALGHTNIRTTQIYIKSLGGSAIFQANKRIWDGVFRNTSCKEVCSNIYNNNDSH